jgi:hypothetical protein
MVIEANEAELSAVVLTNPKGRLLVPLPRAQGQQSAFGGWPTGPGSFTIPGASEASDAYELTPAGLQPLPHKRVTGGIRVALDSCHESLILLTNDRLLLSNLSRRIEKTAERAAQLKRAVATDQVSMSGSGEAAPDQQSAARDKKPTDPLLVARSRLAALDSKTSTGGPAASWQQASAALEAACNAQHSLLQQGADTSDIGSNPLLLHTLTLPLAQRFAAVPQSAGLGGLAAGDFESLDDMLRAGWRHFQHRQTGVSQSVELSTESPHSGRYSLHLSATPERKQDAESVLETAPLWVTSAPVPVQTGDRVTIRGWIRVPEPITGSVDGLLIADSFGGPALALRVRETSDWQSFTLVRAATSSAPLTVTLALTGFGHVHLDDISVETSSVNNRQAQPSLARDLPRTLGRR